MKKQAPIKHSSDPPSGLYGREWWGFVFALLMPFIALVLQWVFWQYISPFVWFLFFPAVFFSARLGRLKGGVISTLLSALIVVYFFIPPQFSWEVNNPYNLFSVGMFLGMGYLFSDIQERFWAANKRTEEALQETRAAHEKITQLYEKTRELDELKTQFFANVSHELRTPLTLILGPVQKAIQSPHLDPETRHDLEIVKRNASFLHRHVNDLLDVSKLDAGHMTIHYSQIDLAQSARVVASQFSVIADERHIGYGVEINGSVLAQVDVEKFQRILLNLLSNAFKFTPDGGTVKLTLEVEADMAVVQVCDSGPGIPGNQREVVFERFRQLEGNASRKHGGTGLGLSIVKEFVELHHGTINIAESPDGGALFMFRIPLSAQAGVVVDPASVEMVPKVSRQLIEELFMERAIIQDPNFVGNPDAPLILVVEDSPDMNEFISTTLGKKYRISTASNGQIGLEKALALKPDLILADVMMPAMSGDQMALAIRQHAELKDVPIVMLTAKADEKLRVQMLQESVQDYINKPFTVEELLARVDNLLTLRRQSVEKLRISELQYRNLFENIPSGVAYCRMIFEDGQPKDWVYLDVNNAFENLTGLKNAAGRRVTDLIPDIRESDPELFLIYARVSRTGHPEKFETYINSLKMWFSVSVYSPGNELFVALFDVITERKQAEEALRESEKRFSSAFEYAAIGVALVSTTGHFLRVNQALCDLLEYPAEELMALSFQDITHPDDLEKDLVYVRQMLEGEINTYQMEKRYFGKQGNLVWVLLSVSLVRDNQDQPQYFISQIQDITKRKQMEEALRKAKNLLTDTERMGNVGGWEFDIDTREQTWTEEVYRIHEVDLTYKPVVSDGINFYAPASKPIIERVVQRAIEAGEPFNEELEIITAKGNHRWVHIIGNADLEHRRVFGFFQDITKRKQAEIVLTARVQFSQFADGHTLDELMQNTLDKAEALTGSQIGFIHFLEADQKTLHLQMWSTNTLKNMCTAEGKGSHYSVDKAGVWVDAVHTRAPIIHNDYPSLAHRKGLPEGHVPLARELVVPVLRNGAIVMIMGVGNKSTDYNASDVEVVSQLAHLSWDVIQRKKVEDALRESNELFSLFMHYSPIYTFVKEVTSCESRVLQASDNYYQMIGVSGQDMIGRTMDELFPPEFAAKFSADDWSVVASGEVLKLDEDFNGRHYTTIKFPIKQRDKTLLAGYTIDITERVQAEEAQRAASAYNRRLLESSIDPFVIIGPDGRITDVNKATEIVTGISREQLIGDEFSNHFTDSEQAKEGYLKALKNGLVTDYPLTIRHTSGKTTDVLYNASVVKNEAGETQGVFAAARDITERKQAEEALRLSELFNKNVLNSLTAHIAVLDERGVIMAVNEAWRKFACENDSPDPDAYLGANYLTVCEAAIKQGDQIADQVDLGIRAVLNGVRSHFSAEYSCDSPTQQRWFTVTVLPQHQSRQGVIVIHQDITEQKQAQQSLEAAHLILKNALNFEKQLARTDPLTGVNNRRYLYELAEHEFEVSLRYQQPLSVLMFDIDHFKKVNDTFGHKIGDEMLKRITQVAVQELRSADVIGRYGGEEFIILLPMTNSEQAFSLAERIRMAVAALGVPSEKGNTTVTLSIGIVEKEWRSSSESVEDVFNRADEAMYTAKQAGRNCTIIGK